MYSVVSCQEEGHPAEAAADIQHAMPAAQVELGCDVTLLGFLCLFEGYVLVVEVGAGILHVLVKEAAIEVGRVVVVVADVAPGAAGQIDNGGKARRFVELPLQFTAARAGSELFVDEDDVQEVRKRTFLDRKRCVYVRPADIEGGMERQPPVQAGVVKSDGCAG